MNAGAMLHFAFAQIVQVRPPLRILFEVIRHMFRKQDVSGLAAIHHSLCDVDSSSGDVSPLVHIGHFVYRAAVNAHAHPQFRMSLQPLAQFQGTSDGRLGTVTKNQRHAIASR